MPGVLSSRVRDLSLNGNALNASLPKIGTVTPNRDLIT